MGDTKVVSLSALAGLLTINFAVSGNGHSDGGAPDSEGGFPYGNQGQPSCGLKVMLIEHDCPGAREKDEPKEAEQLSCCEKFARPLKSLKPGNRPPELGWKSNDKPFRVEPEGSLFDNVIVCVVGAEPSNWGGKVTKAGDSVIGC